MNFTKHVAVLSILLLVFFQISCKQSNHQQIQSTKSTTLKQAYAAYFPIGLGIHIWDIKNDTGKFIASQFSSISTANAFKFEAVHPHADEYSFGEADSLVNFAEKNKLKVRGHTLLWTNRNPYWLFWDPKGNLVHRTLLTERLKEHISTVVGRYKGRVYAWDVVNEAVYDNNKEFLKNNTWYKIMGEEYILKAFQFAHEADSSALLFYNDYDAENPDKLKRIVRLIKMLQEKNVVIHGIGLQAHWTTEYPSLDNIEEAIKTYSSLGLQVHITELEIVDPSSKPGEDVQANQKITNRYIEVFKIFRKYKKEITSVTFWKSGGTSQSYPPMFKSDFTVDERFAGLIRF